MIKNIAESKRLADITPIEEAEILQRIKEVERGVNKYEELESKLEEVSYIYEAAIKEIEVRLSILNNEFAELHSRNPIHSMRTRVKKPQSVLGKLNRKGYEMSYQSIKENIEDIAGIRIICPYIKDIYEIKTLMENQRDLKILRIRDYIKKPKPSGYRSLHLILQVPVFFSDRMESVKVEMQIRTIAMDFWASLEHQLRYKTNSPDAIPEDVSDELKLCADIIAETDIRMQDIHNKVLA